jgi:hypothetical protein
MASKRRLRRVMCTGKRQYRSEPEAWQACRAALRRYHEDLHYYRCRFGTPHFHVGHRWVMKRTRANFKAEQSG